MQHHLKRSLLVLISIALTLPLVGVFIMAPRASAAFPGKNGHLLFVRSRPKRRRSESIASVRRDGSGFQDHLGIGCGGECSNIDWSPSGLSYVHSLLCSSSDCGVQVVIDPAGEESTWKVCGQLGHRVVTG
jgi:hypothetical protein